jgi:pyruvate/2-oxoglutarate dehydrogenase complex dihydrolipoamide dehydrogenase (E3) component
MAERGPGRHLPPHDPFDEVLADSVRPPDWTNPSPTGRYNLAIVGAGTAGLVCAAAAAGLGARVALVERNRLGGDCLNVGCVPSKALIRSAGAAHEARRALEFGLRVPSVDVDFPSVMERMRRLRSELAPRDSVARFSAMGVDVFLGEARFVSRDSLEVDGRRVRFARAVVAAGARPVIPAVPGLAEMAPLTNETLFGLTELPPRLLVVGGGPIGCEMAQAFARFGSEVTILNDVDRLIAREAHAASAILQRRFENEGIRLVLGAAIERFESCRGEKLVRYSRGGESSDVAFDAVLVAAGRRPFLENMGLSEAGVAYDDRGVKADERLRTSNRRIYAAGDVCSSHKFTHAADAMARIAVQNALFFGRKRVSSLVIPHCTYTDPEIARVGITQDEAADRGIPLTTLTVDLRDVDRALLAGETEGFARLHLEKGTDKLAGATIVAPHAGELIAEITLAMTSGLGAGAIADAIHCYPTRSEIVKRLGDAFNRRRLTPRLLGFSRMLMKWRRR